MMRTLAAVLLMCQCVDAGEIVYLQRARSVVSVASPDAADVPSPATPRYPRAVLLTSKYCPPCVALKRELEPEIEALRKMGWSVGATTRDHLQIVDVGQSSEYEALVDESGLPALVCLNREGVIRRLVPGCSTPIDRWSIGWLATGVDQRSGPPVREAASVETTGRYPTRGSWWSVDDQWSPSQASLLSHLSTNSNHRGLWAFTPQLSSMSYAELMSLHSDHHEGRVQWSYLRAEPVTSRQRYYCPTCPN